jgi:DNA-binding GntR family transcriptional regulator
VQKDAYTLILEAIDAGDYMPGDRLVESELAERLGVSRTPVREALQRLETQSMLTRDGRSLIVASLDHNQLAELYVVRTELEGLAARLAARHASEEEIRVLRGMVEDDRKLLGGDPRALARANKRFHKQIHLASHNRFLVQQLDLVHRSMALMATTSLCRRRARCGGAGRTRGDRAGDRGARRRCGAIGAEGAYLQGVRDAAAPRDAGEIGLR